MVRNRKYNINESYFKLIDSNSKAYILGFLAADGCNTNKQIIFQINKRDLEVLQFIRDEICKESPIKEVKNTDKIRLEFNSIEMCKDLTDLGIVKAKTKILKFPFIPVEYLSHFIRGCFDGDGCITKKGKNRLRFSYASASIEFIDKLEKILRRICNLTPRKIYIHKHSGIFYLEYCKKEDIKKLFNFMYENSCFHLKRKYDKFLING